MKWLRSVVAVVLALLLSISIVSLIEGVGHNVFPPSEEVREVMRPIGEMTDMGEKIVAVRAEMARPEVREKFLRQPFTVFVPPLFSWVLAGMMGSWAAGLIARRQAKTHGWVAGGLFLFATLANLLSLPHPIWVWVVTLTLVPTAIFLGGSLAEVRLGEADGPPSRLDDQLDASAKAV